MFLGFFISRRPATGFKRAEDIAGLGVALIIWASAVFAGFESYHKLVSQGPTRHLAWGMAGAALGIAANQLVARYKRQVGTRIHSATLLADAKHSWLDAVSSAGALAGLVAVGFGFRPGDPLAGFAITLFIGHVGFEATRYVFHHLMDGVEPDLLNSGVPWQNAKAVHPFLWSVDSSGRSLLVEMEPLLPTGTSLAEANKIGARMRDAVLGEVAEATSVTVVPLVRIDVIAPPDAEQ